ncbi:MAG: hypothetical protein ACOYLS_01185 [Polymorphobacter sp.]
MTSSPYVNGLLLLFSLTTIAVFLYPIIKLTPSWLDRSMQKKIVLHRRAADALGLALAGAHNNPDHHARLTAQREYHLSALRTLVPAEFEAGEIRAVQKIDAAA